MLILKILRQRVALVLWLIIRMTWEEIVVGLSIAPRLKITIGLEMVEVGKMDLTGH